MYLKHVAKPLSKWITFSKMLQANRKKPDEEILSAISSAHIRPAVNNATKTSQAKLDLEQMISPMSCIHQRSQFEKLHRRKKVKGSESAVLHKQGGSGIQDNQIVWKWRSSIVDWPMGNGEATRLSTQNRQRTNTLHRLHVKIGVCRESYTRTSMRKDSKSVFRD